MKNIISLASVACLTGMFAATGCTTNDDGGGTAGSGGGSNTTASTTTTTGTGTTYAPCADKVCGASCLPCDPADAGCAADAVVHYCDAQGSCGGGAFPLCDDSPSECSTSAECPAPGAACQVCPDGSSACPSVDCVEGQCKFSFEPCAGGCASDAECPAPGAPCQQCADGTVVCPSSSCASGECVANFPSCPGYEPCAGKACGDECTVCDPNDADCGETKVLKYCDGGGNCGLNTPVCL